MTHFDKDQNTDNFLTRSEAFSLITTKEENDVSYVNTLGDKMKGVLDMNNHKITNLPMPVSEKDVVCKGYADLVATTAANYATATLGENHFSYVDKSKLDMKVNIDMNGNRIMDLPQPSGDKQPATKKYVDDKIINIKTDEKASKFIVPFRITRRNVSYPVATVTIDDIQLPSIQNSDQVYVIATLQDTKFISMKVQKEIKGPKGDRNKLKLTFDLSVWPSEAAKSKKLEDFVIEGIVFCSEVKAQADQSVLVTPEVRRELGL